MTEKQTSALKKTALVWFLGLNALFLLCTALIGLWLTRQVGQGGLESVDAWLEEARPWLTGIRLGLIAAIIALWPQAIALLAKRHGWQEQRKEFMLGLRGRVALWLLVAEGLLAHNGLAVLAQLISSP